MVKGKEKRKYKRATLPVPVQLYKGGDAEEFWNGVMKDVSEDGVAFECARSLKLNDRIIVSFQLPTGKECSLITDIKHVTKTKKGIALGACYYMAAVRDRAALRKYVQKQSTKKA